MAAKETTLSGSVVSETAGTNLSINRLPVASTPPSIQFQVGAGYADSLYLTDATGAKIQLLQSNQNPRFIGFTPQQTEAFYATPATSPDYPTVTTLGDLLAAMWDAAIVADLSKPVV